MATIAVTDWSKKKLKEIDLNTVIFEGPLRKDLLQTVVKWQLASRRQGTHKTKTRSEVRGGGKKPFKQKGTGNARQGSTRSPLMPGGAKLFGPVPRSYAYALPKQMRRVALRMALSHLNKEGKLFVIDNIKSEGKTGEFAKRVAGFGLKKAVLVDTTANEKVKRASQNLKAYKYLAVMGVNVYDLLKYDAAVISKDSLASLVERCKAE